MLRFGLSQVDAGKSSERLVPGGVLSTSKGCQSSPYMGFRAVPKS